MEMVMKRRDFLKAAGVGMAGVSLGTPLGCGQRGLVEARRQTPGPNEKIVMGIIGVGGIGKAHLNWFSGFDDVEVVALCDVDRNSLEKAGKELGEKRPGSKPDLYGDFRRVLDRKDIHAVSVATPDHWHALITMHAFLAGKDVYCEKPLSYGLSEGRAMLDAQKRTGRVFQLGTQIHAGDNYHRVVELVRSGALGPIHTVRVWKTGGAPFLKNLPNQDPPKHLDWNMWLGPRPMRPYNLNLAPFQFRFFWDFSGGKYADFWCHISDIPFWALELGSPLTVEARGKLNENGMAETHEWIDVDFEFKNLKYHWTTVPPDVPGAEGGIGACFMGDRGHLVTNYGSRKIFINGERVEGDDLLEVGRSVPRSPGHQRNFLDCVRSRKLTESNLAYAHNMTIPMHLGLISFWTGRKLRWNGRSEQFVRDKEANALLDKTYRQPWSLPRV